MAGDGVAAGPPGSLSLCICIQGAKGPMLMLSYLFLFIHPHAPVHRNDALLFRVTPRLIPQLNFTKNVLTELFINMFLG